MPPCCSVRPARWGRRLQTVGVTWGYYLFYAAPYVVTLTVLIITARGGRSASRHARPAFDRTLTMTSTFVAAEPYPWPFDGSLAPQTTALIVIDMQTDFCGIGGYVDAMGYDLSLTRAPIAPIAGVLAALRPRGYHDLPHARRPPARSVRPAGQQTLAVAPHRCGHRR